MVWDLIEAEKAGGCYAPAGFALARSFPIACAIGWTAVILIRPLGVFKKQWVAYRPVSRRNNRNSLGAVTTLRASRLRARFKLLSQFVEPAVILIRPLGVFKKQWVAYRPVSRRNNRNSLGAVTTLRASRLRARIQLLAQLVEPHR
ncbi:hypothetical protein [Microbulbifer donghaiensis]|uniref:hypothetical protein n=1 Tax=Microbulbifer donghaiensis TaxID=494016 RepID=UPI001160E395|nr:hypothetical protein [Microbulbifer donghaiensis]